ncbi:unnamed protein product [Anisakis simplex]|uniref:Lipid droplet-associated serine hydrolase n=1 Tax=Anisakis simplex TaxID=6269 RepID=A0A0M3JD33_ANISI|nr:unnamed protein product [Anisakis simplex]
MISNPGNEGFYEHFGRELLKNLESEKQRCEAAKNDNYILYTVSHLNHVPLPNELHHQSSAHKESDRFDLNDQTEHKLAFCKEYLAKSHRIVMLGHSIGSFIMLK